MPIEFECPECQNRLRVPDGSEGQTALCPKCSLQFTVPDQSDSATSSNPPSPGDDANSNPFATSPPSSSGTNPYAAPTASTEIPADGPQASLTNSSISFDQVLSETWAGFTENLGAFLLLGLIIVGLYVGTSIITVPISLAAQASGDVTVAVILEIVSAILSQVFGAFIAAVGFRYTLDVLSGSRSPFDRAFKVFPFVLRVLGANIVVGLLVFASILLIALPAIPVFFFGRNNEVLMIATFAVIGVVVFAMYIFVFTRLCLPVLFIIDRGEGVIESVSSSFTYTKGNALTIFLSMLVIGLAGSVVALVTCGLGLIAVIPVMLTALAIIYRLTTGQPPRISRAGAASDQ